MIKLIKPIETEYKGYKFRSRLEARWAVFFDTAGIPYQYEPEGFILEDGKRYLPDFYLPWFRAYVEIKPLSINREDEALAKRKCEMLFSHPDCIVLFCKGDPMDNQMEVYVNQESSSGGGQIWGLAKLLEGPEHTDPIYGGGYGYTRHCIALVISDPDAGYPLPSYFDGYDKMQLFHYSDSSWNYIPSVTCCSWITNYRNDLGYAKVAARQARFEHGAQI